jgi:hypothetical protein
MILFFSEYHVSEWESLDSSFTMITSSCKKLAAWMEKFIDIRFYDYPDYKDFLNNDIFHLIPKVDEDEFSVVTESILVLE